MPFRIPALGDTETRIYVTLLLVGAELGDEDPAFNALIGAARERLKRPWIGGTLDAATVRTALGDKASRAINALALSDQIGPILASGTKGNPRQIKRFLNTLVLRERTADARGFGDDVKLPVLAKLMLAERFIPRLFDQIAAAAAVDPDGKSADLAALETAATEPDAPKTPPKKPAGDKADGARAAPKLELAKNSESAQLGEWLSSPAIKAWAAVQPAVGAEDLRPYLFVAKDRKDYFGAASVLGHLAGVVEQLFGGKFAVQGLEGDLKRLAPPKPRRCSRRFAGGSSVATASTRSRPAPSGSVCWSKRTRRCKAGSSTSSKPCRATASGPGPAVVGKAFSRTRTRPSVLIAFCSPGARTAARC